MAIFSGPTKGEDVTALIAKKNYSKAIEVLREQLKTKKDDPRVRMQLSDVLILSGKGQQAIPVLMGLADEFAREGFAAKAISVLKKIQKIDPGRRDVDTKLASLIQEKQRVATVAAPPSGGGGFEIGMEEIGFDAPSPAPARNERPAPVPEEEPAPEMGFEAAPEPEPPPPPPRPAPAPPRAAPPRPAPAPAMPAPVEDMDFGGGEELTLEAEPEPAPPPRSAPPPPKPAPAAKPAARPAPPPPKPAARPKPPEPELTLEPEPEPELTLEPEPEALPLEAVAVEADPEFNLEASGEPEFQLDEPEAVSPEAEVDVEPEPAAEADPMSDTAFADELMSLVDDVFQGFPTDEAAPSASDAPSGPTQIVVSPLFKDLSVDEMVAIIAGLKLITFNRGDVIIREGQRGDALYMLTSGRVKAFRKGQGKQMPLRELEEGAFFGEVSILTGKPRTASIVALTDCELLELDKPTLDSIVETHPHVMDVMKQFARERTGAK